MLASGPTSRSDAAGNVVICGAGAAGIAAALSAARQGARVVLLESTPQIGGTVAHALIHTLAGFYDSAGWLINDGLPRELVERLLSEDSLARRRKMSRCWVLHVCPNAYQAAVTRWIREMPSIHVLCGRRATRVIRSGDRIVALDIRGPDRDVRLEAQAVIDATGTAEIVRLLDQTLIIDDERRSAGGWIFRIRGVAPSALVPPSGIAVVRALREAAAAGSLPGECRHAWIDSGIVDDEAFVKLFIPLRGRWKERERRGEVSAAASATQQAVVSFLRTLPAFARAEVSQVGALGIRDGGRIRGRYMLTGNDVRAGRTFPDAVGRCSWPIEYWDPDSGVSLEYLPDGTCFEIPMASLMLAGLENLWTVGKCLSADREAHSSARVVGACWAMGEAAGKAAAACLSPLRSSCGAAP